MTKEKAVGIMRAYRCPNCGDFTVIHTDRRARQKVCGWCWAAVKCVGRGGRSKKGT